MKTIVKIYTKPICKGRPRFYHGKVFTPQTTREFESLVAATYQNSTSNYYEDEYLKIKLLFEFQAPKSYPKHKREKALRGIIKPTKGDIDNYIKSILDALNGVAWSDDRFLYHIEAEKKYSEVNCITIEIENI